MKQRFLVLFMMLFTFASNAQETQGKILATSGLMQVEGAGGGGLVPWATLAGHDTRDEFSINAVMTRVSLPDYSLNVIGVSTSIYDRVELGISKQEFDLKTLGGQIRQHTFSAKYRIYGDAVYSKWPQLSVGILHKSLEDKAVARALGAADTSGTDFYLAATKIHLAALNGYSLVWNLTARATKANELGLLGFGSASGDDSHELMLEGSLGVLLSRHLIVGAEYRQKPDNLGLGESDWTDIFVTYVPSKSFNVTLAWADLDTIAGATGQKGLYFSLNGQIR